MNKNNKGITIIALIITIIIMLILAGVVIDIAIDGDLFDRAQSAVDKTNEKVSQTQSRVDELMGKLQTVEQSQCSHTYSNGVCTKCGYECTNHIFVHGICTICGAEKGPIKPGEIASENSNYKDKNDVIVVIPQGFMVSENPNEQTVEDGLVIMDDDENEFVWIPVARIDNMVMCKNHANSTISYNQTTGKLECSQCKTNGIENTNFAGILYTGDNFTPDKTYDDSDTYKEPEVLMSSSSGDGYISSSSYRTTRGAYLINSLLGIKDDNGGFTVSDMTSANQVRDNFGKLMQNRFNEMATSVAKNGGFYIGRYETTIIDGTTTKAGSQKGKTVMSGKSWYQLYKSEYEYSPKEDTNKGVTSEMIWGCQWDQMALFLASKERKDGGGNNFNIMKSENKRKGSTYTLSGSNINDSVANIYDLEGNYLEKTQAKYDTRLS